MKIEIKGKEYGFIWGTKCFINTQKQLGVDVNTFLGSLTNPEVLTVVIYNALSLWSEKNNVDAPFTDLDDFILEYDTLFESEIYEYIVTDLLESMYMGDEVHKYISKVYGIDINGIEQSKEAKKKYLLTLEKSQSNSQAGVTSTKKSNTSRSKNTK